MNTTGCVYINGRFLEQGLSGVQRYAREMVAALDRLIEHDEWASSCRWRLLAPPGVACDLRLESIDFRQVGSGGGHLWEQTSLFSAARDGVLLDLGNAGPILHRRHFAVLHDATVFRYPENFSRRYAFAHQALSRCLAKSARIGTVSEFSRAELAELLQLDRESITVAFNGADHLSSCAQDGAIVERLNLTRGRFFLFVGSPTKTKNLQTAVRAFRQLDRSDVALVVVGGLAKNVFGEVAALAGDGVVAPGRLTDSEIAGLYGQAAALVFPSLYEGFGIPLVEAMANDCPVLASDIEPSREVCDDAAEYFPPHDPDRLSILMNERLARPQREAWAELGRQRVRRFRWSGSASVVLNVLKDLDR